MFSGKSATKFAVNRTASRRAKMIDKVFTSVEEALASTEGKLARAVLEYSLIYKRVTDKAKSAPVNAADFDAMAALVDVERFERIGIMKEFMRWPEYAKFLADYANTSVWEGSFKRVSELPGLVFLELEERGGPNDGSQGYVVNTLTVYEFNDAGKITHLDVYLQGAAQAA
jgi:hypothetical protein